MYLAYLYSLEGLKVRDRFECKILRHVEPCDYPRYISNRVLLDIILRIYVALIIFTLYIMYVFLRLSLKVCNKVSSS